MNVIGARPDGWWRDRHAATLRLVEALDRWAAAGRHRVIVVCEKPPSPPILSAVIEVAAAPRAAPNSADDEIVRRVRADPHPEQLTVVTSDAALADRVRAAGAEVYPARRFRDLIEPGTRES